MAVLVAISANLAFRRGWQVAEPITGPLHRIGQLEHLRARHTWQQGTVPYWTISLRDGRMVIAGHNGDMRLRRGDFVCLYHSTGKWTAASRFAIVDPSRCRDEGPAAAREID